LSGCRSGLNRFKRQKEDPLILVLYIDDLFFTGAKELIVGYKVDFVSAFDMKDIGFMNYFLGL
jgi:hypothetical protein